MRLIFSEEAWDDYLHWQRHDRRMLQRINRLIEEIRRDPFTGIGKPEPLRHALAGYWPPRRRYGWDAPFLRPCQVVRVVDDLLTLPLKQRLELVQTLWDSIAAEQAGPDLSEDDRQLIDDRLSRFLADRNPGLNAEQVLDQLEQSL